MPEKNQQFKAVITDITSEGNGVCRVDNMAVFVPETAKGDEIVGKIVKVLKNYAFGIVLEYVKNLRTELNLTVTIIPNAADVHSDIFHMLPNVR